MNVRFCFFTALCIFAFSCGTLFSDITYTLHLSGVDEGIRTQIETSMAEAVGLYNQYGSFNKNLNVYYSSGVPTAQANYDGVITFGGSRNSRVAMHEILHTLGVGTYWAWGNNLSGGVWTGQYANALIQEFDGAGAEVHGDKDHFWPYGLNYDSEDGKLVRVRTIRMAAALVSDMGLYSFTQEPAYQNVAPGGTAVFSAYAPLAYGYAWYKQGHPSPLSNGGDISGANTSTLQIANVDLSDEGRYYCVASSSSGTLACRPASLNVVQTAARLAGHWSFDGHALDGAGPNHGTVIGSAVYTAGQVDESIHFDGNSDYVILPSGILNIDDFTIAAWVSWNGGSAWQRIFDFGNDTSRYMYLTPSSGGGRLRFSISITGNSNHQLLETTSPLATGQWVHLAVTLNGNTGTLYVNGAPVATNSSMTLNPSDFNPLYNYIGNSQWMDPYFNGSIDDFRIYNYALSGPQVAAIAQGNTAPYFAVDPIVNLDGIELREYEGYSLADYAEDVDGVESLTFSKTAGPGWLEVASDGALSGIPGDADTGLNVFTVRVTDTGGLFGTAEMTLEVADVYSGVRGLEDLAGLAGRWLDADCPDTPACGGADLSGDAIVDLLDLQVASRNWLADEGLKLHFKFDETAGGIAGDSSVFNRTGLLAGDPAWSAGIAGGALTFDGAEDAVEVLDYKGISGSASRTCAAWIRTSALNEAILTYGDFIPGGRWLFLLDANGRLQLGISGGNIISTQMVADGTWHHVAAVLDAPEGDQATVGNLKLYIDGQPAPGTYTNSSQGIDTASNFPVRVGVMQHSGDVLQLFFNGRLDEVRLYDRALTDQEILELAGL